MSARSASGARAAAASSFVTVWSSPWRMLTSSPVEPTGRD